MESVRTATAADSPRVAELVGAFVAERADGRGGGTLLPDDPGVAGLPGADLGPWLGDPDRTVLVGLLDTWPAGVAVCRAVGEGRDRRGVLAACYVEPGAREVGLGRLLLDAALVWCAERGCTAVDGTALPGDRSAKNFYEAAGFKARLLVMHRPLDGPPDEGP